MYYGSNYYGGWYYNSWYYGGGAPPGPSPAPHNDMVGAEGAKGGYTVPDQWYPSDNKRRFDTDDELVVILGGPLL